MRKKRQKIKRYRRSFNSQAERGLTIRRILSFIALLVVLFLAGWLLAEPAINLLSSVWYSMKAGLTNSLPQSQSQSVSQPESQSQTQSQPVKSEPDSEPIAQTAQGNWAFVSLSALTNEDIAEETAKNLAAQGISGAVITLKDDRGYIYYNSTIPNAANSISENTLDAKMVADTLLKNGIAPIAYISAFKDSLAPKFNRDMAVIYQGQENYLWLDNRPDLGGNPWLSPNSQIAVDYTTGIINEALAFGYTNIVVSNALYPDVLGLDSATFARAGDTRERYQVIKECVTAWQDAIGKKQGVLWLEYPVEAALDDNNKSAYGNLFELGMENILLDYKKSVLTNEQGVSIDDALHDAAKAKATQNNVNLGIRISGGNLSSDEIYKLTAGAKQKGFQCFVVQ